MRILIVGYGEMFEALCLGLINSKHDLVAAFRHENVLYNSIKRSIYDKIFPSLEYKLIKNLYIYDIIASGVNTEKFRKEVNKLNIDLIIVGSWSEKFSNKTINSAKIATINVHPSLLPAYRGPNPYFRTIINKESKTGVTFHLMDSNFDSGAIIEQIPIDISEKETGRSLKYKCTNAVKSNIADIIDNIEEKIKNSIIQDETASSYYKQITLEESIIDFQKESSEDIDRRIRALNPWLSCSIPYKTEFLGFKNYKITDTKSTQMAGTIISKSVNSISIVCKDSIVIEFSDLILRRPFSKLITNLFIKYFIKVNTLAV